jgi:hypothetical protein
MAVREHNLETTGAVYVSFKVHQTAGANDLSDADIGKAVTLTGNYEVGPGSDGDILLGKLIDLSLTDADGTNRVATVQIGGVMTLPSSATTPALGNQVVVDGDGSVRQAPALTGYDPAGGNVGRGLVVDVNGTSEVTLIL